MPAVTTATQPLTPINPPALPDTPAAVDAATGTGAVVKAAADPATAQAADAFDAVTSPVAAAGQPPAHVAFPKNIKSFVRRAGRTTTGQAKAFELLGPRFVLAHSAAPLDLAQAFGRDASVVLEIGFGMGDATAHIAALMPEINFLCCEVHEPGVGALLKRIGESGIGNIRILQHDAVEVLDTMLRPWQADGSAGPGLAGIHVFFPDPWHKSRHNKRRLLQGPLVAKLAARLQSGGYLHCATDWEPYAQQILEVLSAEPLLRNSADAFAVKPAYRPLTKFENRGIRLGHGVWDIIFRRA